jgi:hypothetical protein
MTRSLKVSDEATAEIVRIIEWSKSYPLLISLVYDVWNELKQSVFKEQERIILLGVTARTSTKDGQFVACFITR